MDDHVEGGRHLAADGDAEGGDLGVDVLPELPPAQEDHVLAQHQPVHVREGEAAVTKRRCCKLYCFLFLRPRREVLILSQTCLISTKTSLLLQAGGQLLQVPNLV